MYISPYVSITHNILRALRSWRNLVVCVARWSFAKNYRYVQPEFNLPDESPNRIMGEKNEWIDVIIYKSTKVEEKERYEKNSFWLINAHHNNPSREPPFTILATLEKTCSIQLLLTTHHIYLSLHGYNVLTGSYLDKSTEHVTKGIYTKHNWQTLCLFQKKIYSRCLFSPPLKRKLLLRNTKKIPKALYYPTAYIKK